MQILYFNQLKKIIDIDIFPKVPIFKKWVWSQGNSFKIFFFADAPFLFLEGFGLWENIEVHVK